MSDASRADESIETRPFGSIWENFTRGDKGPVSEEEAIEARKRAGLQVPGDDEKSS